MWLKNIRIENFRSIRHVEVTFSRGVNPIFGENGTGKSNLIRAVLKLLGPSYPGGKSFSIDDHYARDPANEIEIELTFDADGATRQLSWAPDGSSPSRLKLDGRYCNDADRVKYIPLHFPAERGIVEAPGQNTWNPIGRILSELSEMVKSHPGFVKEFESKVVDLNATLESAAPYALFKNNLAKYSRDHLGKRGDGIHVELGLVDPQQVLRTLRIFEAAGPSLYNVADGGQGVQSSITMAALRAFAELTGGRLFVIADEPEAYLHPLAQHALCSVFEGLAQSDTQVLLTTHSPQFISANYLEGLHKVWMEHRATRVQGFDTNRIRAKQAARLPRPEEREAILAHLSKSLSLEAREGLFAQLVVLCEGETESMSLPLWSELLGSSLAKEGIAVIQAQGKFSIIRLAEFYDSFDIPTYLIFDSDDDEPDSNKRREHARHNRWLLERANSSPTDFPPTTVGASYAVFSPDIESVLRADASYASAEAQVNSSLGLRAGSNKGIRARFVARHFIDRGMPVPSVIRSLIEAILACGESTPARS